MKIELFTLCEGAFNTDGRLTIVNTFDDIKSDHFPLKYALGVALKVFIPKTECKDYELKLSIVSADNTILHEIKAPLKMSQNNEDIHMALATNIQGIVFNAAGNYHVNVAFDNNNLLSYSFNVEQ